jgi:hypothetical protein
MTNAQCLGALTMDAFPFPSSKMPVMRVIQLQDFLQYTAIAVFVYISVLFVLRQNVLNSGFQFSFERSILPGEGRSIILLTVRTGFRTPRLCYCHPTLPIIILYESSRQMRSSSLFCCKFVVRGTES